jgi:hypothetical protein
MSDEQILTKQDMNGRKLSYAANAEWKRDLLDTWVPRWSFTFFTEMVPRGGEQRAPLEGVIRERRVRSGGQH